uniref:RNA helicase n=1 Tax=Arion vulgaris TaxID=1028688 RepID=A0A0B7BGA0_9EUPU
MAFFSDSSDDFTSLSLNDPKMDMPSYQHMVPANGNDVTAQDKCSYNSDDDLDEKYESEENEKGCETQAVQKLQLRDYQIELAEYAIEGYNTIIYAPTGSGKTGVATYIIGEHLKHSHGKGKVVFLANVVSLADQQYKYLCKYLPSYQTALITGESYNSMSLHLSIPDNDILVMTPMILQNHLKCKLVPHLGVFSMIVFDECHHTREGEPYNTLMRSYHKTKIDITQARNSRKETNITLPQIVGLTASIGIEGAEILEVAKDNILKICANLDISLMSTIKDNLKELEEHVPVPRDETRPLSERREDDSVFKIIEVMQKLEKHMENYIKELPNDKLTKELNARPANRKSQEYEQWTISTMKVAKALPMRFSSKQNDVHIRLVIIAANYLKEYRFALETYDLVELEDVMEYLEKSFQDLKRHEQRMTEENIFYDYFVYLKRYVLSREPEDNPNLSILTNTLMEYIVRKSKESRVIIFVRTRALAVALSRWLNRCKMQEIRDLNACSFTGANVPEQKGGTPQAKQESILQNFRTGIVRLIVSTSVAEEGLDIALCNLVVKYNHVGNEVSTVQTKGRSRAVGGVSMLLAMDIILQRERVNQAKAELMRKAILSIQKMSKYEFGKAIEKHLEDIYAELTSDTAIENKTRPDQLFEIVCSLCRKVKLPSTNFRTIYDKYRISIDRDLLKETINYPKQVTSIDEIQFVGNVKCQGETIPGKKCFNPLGQMIKFKDVSFIAIGIKNVVFNIGNHTDLQQYKKWSKVPFLVDELSDEDIIRYLSDTGVKRAPDSANEDYSLDDEINMQRYRRWNSNTDVKRPY